MTGTVATVGGQPALVSQLALDFLTADPIPTIMPIRRA
jgi:hypothetical protein